MKGRQNIIIFIYWNGKQCYVLRQSIIIFLSNGSVFEVFQVLRYMQPPLPIDKTNKKCFLFLTSVLFQLLVIEAFFSDL